MDHSRHSNCSHNKINQKTEKEKRKEKQQDPVKAMLTMAIEMHVRVATIKDALTEHLCHSSYKSYKGETTYYQGAKQLPYNSQEISQ